MNDKEALEKLDHTLCLNHNEGNLKYNIDMSLILSLPFHSYVFYLMLENYSNISIIPYYLKVVNSNFLNNMV